jgi:hypothetical protein
MLREYHNRTIILFENREWDNCCQNEGSGSRMINNYQKQIILVKEKKVMNSIIYIVGFVLMASVVSAGDLKVRIGDKDITLKNTSINREITAKDKGKGGQNSAMECSFLFYSLIAKGDIQGASKLTTDPVKAEEKWTSYRQRVGEEDFNKEMGSYFTSKNILVAELAVGNDVMLVVKTADGQIGQLYQKKGEKYFLTEMPFSDSAKTLGKVLAMIREGKIKL